VVAVGSNDYRQCNVDDWTDIVQVAAGCRHTVGLRSDGSVVAVGANDYDQCAVDDWTDMVQVAAGCLHTVGLRSDGTVVTTGWDDFGGLTVGDATWAIGQTSCRWRLATATLWGSGRTAPWSLWDPTAGYSVTWATGI
jgi:alpha-tubulin suppressor-like RCC1 family protein